MDSERKIFNDLKDEAQSWLPAYREIKTYVAPTRGFFEDQPNRGKKIDHQDLLDSHATYAMKVLASGMTSGLTSPSRPWFKLSISDQKLMKSKAVKEYLEEVQNILMDSFSKSNFYGVLNSAYEELTSFGTAAFSLEEDFKDVLRGKNFTCGEYRIGIDSKGRANQFAREIWYTVGQLVEEFGEENVTQATKKLFKDKKYSTWLKVNHLVIPNWKRNPLLDDNKNFEYTSKYWEQTSKDGEYLAESGYEEFPIICPRWSVTTTSDIYGKSPAWEALGDIKMLQKLQRKKFEALDKVIDPPTNVDDSVLDPNIMTLPGGMNRVSGSMGNTGVRPAYQINPDFNSIRVEINETKQAIDRFFFTDVFLAMLNDGRSGITATEVIEIHGEKLLMLGPILERIENEMLDPAIDRAFSIHQRSGFLPEPPEELEGINLKVEYISTLAQAQKMAGITSIQQTASFIGNLAAANSEVLDIMDFDIAGAEYAELTGISPRIIRSSEEINKKREARAQAAQAQQQAQMTSQMVSGAKVLSDTEIGNNSALDQILGMTQ